MLLMHYIIRLWLKNTLKYVRFWSIAFNTRAANALHHKALAKKHTLKSVGFWSIAINTCVTHYNALAK
jgi:hypothetical protein